MTDEAWEAYDQSRKEWHAALTDYRIGRTSKEAVDSTFERMRQLDAEFVRLALQLYDADHQPGQQNSDCVLRSQRSQLDAGQD